MKATVISTIHSVGVRAIFRRGLSGWLSWGSSRWAETARAPARRARKPVAHGSTGRGQRSAQVIGCRCQPRSVTCVYAPVTDLHRLRNRRRRTAPVRSDRGRPRTCPLAGPCENRPCSSVDTRGRRCRRSTVAMHIASERAYRGTGCSTALDGTGRDRASRRRGCPSPPAPAGDNPRGGRRDANSSRRPPAGSSSLGRPRTVGGLPAGQAPPYASGRRVAMYGRFRNRSA